MAILLQVVFKNPSLENIIAVFGPTGLITFTSSRILKMWTDCTEIIRLHISNGQSKKVKSDE
jgi:hypothetical protein